ncbi:hypothetical protein I3843_13G082500 [Carya illinoinensis]|nr:hypothetical protein I3843_13G082500 [Carya illinoinensis]
MTLNFLIVLQILLYHFKRLSEYLLNGPPKINVGFSPSKENSFKNFANPDGVGRTL